MPNAAAEAKKGEGNNFFKVKDYANAVEKYTEAIELDPGNHVYYSNRSAAYGGWHKWEQAVADGQKCIQINPNFVKGYHRCALAQKQLGNYKEALETLKAGQKVDFGNADLKKLLLEVEKLAKDAELAKRRNMSPGELLKEQGNDLFKNAQFEAAIEKYTEAISMLKDKKSSTAIACYNNRAACNQQISNYKAVIEDCSMVLEADPKNVKALLRRGLAFEGLERYRSALQDIREVLAINPNIDIANKAQHRIGSAVRQLKQQSKS